MHTLRPLQADHRTFATRQQDQAERQRQRQQGFKADDSGFGLIERQALRILVLRIVIGRNDVDRSVPDTLDHGEPVVFGLPTYRSVSYEDGAERKSCVSPDFKGL